MKKPLLILLCLIGLSAFNQVSAQSDLDIVNNTGCDFNLTSVDIDPSCLPGTTNTNFVAAGAIFTVTHFGFPNVVAKIGVLDCTGTIGVGLWDYTMCGLSNNLTAVIPASACCPNPVTVTFTPSTAATNAIITIF